MSRETEGSLAAPRRRLWWAAAVGLGVGLAIIAGLAVVSGEQARPRADASRRPAPPPAGAFATGGAPPALPATVRTAFSETLSDWVIALDRLGDASREADRAGYDAAETAMAEARAALMSAPVGEALGGEALARLGRVLDRAHDAAAAPSERERQASEAMLDAIGSLNDALAGRGAALFLDGDVMEGPRGRRIVLLYAFEVEHVRLLEAAGDTVRALQVRRLDRLNWSHRLLGFTSPHLREAVVLLDQVDELLVSYVLPALAADAAVALVDRRSEDAGVAWQRAVSERAGDVIRADYARAEGFDRAAAARLGELLAARRALFARWDAVLARRGASLREPRGLRIDDIAELRRSLAGVVELDELDELEQVIAGGASQQVFAAARAVLCASVERHEVQHRIDAALATPRPLPAALERYVGPIGDERGEPRALPQLARDELSAYLADLARDPITPRVNLTLLSRFLLDQRRWGSAESYAALVIFEGLAAELGLDGGGPLLASGHVDRERTARIYLALSDQPVERLRGAARALWEELFGTSLPAIALIDAGRDAGGAPARASR